MSTHDTRCAGASEGIARRCQIIAGRVETSSAYSAFGELYALTDGLPRKLDSRDALCIHVILCSFLARLSHKGGFALGPSGMKAFVAFASAVVSDDWRAQWASLIHACEESKGHELAQAPSQDGRIKQIMDLIRSGYSDPSLTLRAAAHEVGLSRWHTVRLLKRDTGLGWVRHLHRQRIEAARELLLNPALPIKCIASVVGYTHQSDFTRHFKQKCGVTPSVFRKHSTVPSRS